MSVCRKTSRVYCDIDDLDGCMNVLAREVGETDDALYRAFAKGAYYTFLILRHYERVETQADFVPILHRYWQDEYDRRPWEDA